MASAAKPTAVDSVFSALQGITSMTWAYANFQNPTVNPLTLLRMFVSVAIRGTS